MRPRAIFTRRKSMMPNTTSCVVSVGGRVGLCYGVNGLTAVPLASLGDASAV